MSFHNNDAGFHDVNDAISRHNIEVHLPTQVLERTLSASKGPPRSLGESRVKLPPFCAAIEVHLPTPVLGRTLSPRKGSPQIVEYEESDAVPLLRLTRVAMRNDPPHTISQTLSVSPFHPVKNHWYCQCLVHGTQRALVHGELFNTVSL
ncbi:hypothetical protein E2C01_054168 [Portunus trituberculatus]|uniref:Uncharacterized protein n=1 Tax=Portunus trituberculatus TaxID=210409 RepID=A0A5B7GJ58_PORTR|nr:hypothetical protein [Portunus trituberculatus]